MTNSKWYAFKLRLWELIARHLPDSIKRQVLYELVERVCIELGQSKVDEPDFDCDKLTFNQLCATLRD
jgi:hypothetical protein